MSVMGSTYSTNTFTLSSKPAFCARSGTIKNFGAITRVASATSGAREGTVAARMPRRVAGMPVRAAGPPAAIRRGQKSRRWRSHSGLKALLKPDQADQLCDLEAI